MHDKKHLDWIYDLKAKETEWNNFPEIQSTDECTEAIDWPDYYLATKVPHTPHDWSLDCPAF